MSARIYIEGGGDSKELHIRCRAGFRRLLEKCGFQGPMPELVACGGRHDAFDGFQTRHRNNSGGGYVGLLVDSEDPVEDIEKTWEHLKGRDNWLKPDGADNEQVLLMTTSMETWIASDRQALREHYGPNLQESALPSLTDMESRDRRSVLRALVQATRNCTNSYRKGEPSFEILGKLNPTTLRQHLPSFARCKRVLDSRL